MAVLNATKLIIENSSVAIEDLQNCSITVNVETIDVTTKDSNGWRELIAGVGSWSGSGDSLVDKTATEGYEEQYDDIIAKTAVTIKFTTQETGDTYWEGPAILTSWELSGGTEEALSVSYSFEGTGQLTKGTEI